jgi:carbonic anhydrase-like protein
MSTYHSTVAYKNDGVRTAAMYCSDGRFGAQCEDFLRNGLGVDHFDLVVLPGGPARLAGYEDPAFADNAVLDELAFLVEAHSLERVILIQHDDCGFYQHKLGISADKLRPLQDTDVARAVDAVRQATGLARIECYQAVHDDDGVRFEPVSPDV